MYFREIEYAIQNSVIYLASRKTTPGHKWSWAGLIGAILNFSLEYTILLKINNYCSQFCIMLL